MRSSWKIAIAAALALLIAGCAREPTRRTPAPLAASACADFSYPIYFEKGSDQLTAAARAVVDSSVKQVHGCKVTKIEVLGLADADGGKQRNLELSRRRATNVARALAGEGMPAPAFDIDAIGELGAKALDGKPEPLRRRTEVVIHAEPGR
jgi:outer membrane protein OmpA-like peptidoglycan-associated protein